MAATGADIFAELRETYARDAIRAIVYLERNLFAARRSLEKATVPDQAKWVTAAMDLTVSAHLLGLLAEIEQRQKAGRP